MQAASFSFPTSIRFGAGTLREQPERLRGLGCKKPLLVTDTGLARAPIFGALKDVLSSAGLGFAEFAGIEPNPLPSQIEAGVAAYRAGGCDGIVGFGGGSGLDGAKAIALMANHPGSVLDYDGAKKGWERVRADLVPPFVAIPTTAGTGSEVGRSTVITDPATKTKRVIFAPPLLPKLAILDPELTLGLPPAITAATGMDALSHCIESYVSKEFHPICDAIAIHGVRLIAANLARAVKDGKTDVEARGNMLIAASMGAIAFQKDLGATHSFAHPLSTLASVPHGTANGMFLARVMRMNLDAATAKLADVAHAFGVAKHQDARADALAACEAVQKLADEIGIPKRLRDVGVTDALLEPLARQAIADGCHATNPRVFSYEDFLAGYREAY
ncbi:MAG TPA: iron-containing alcohol dehydrogenase [Planctomycetota bacterium]|nr:iron-containing alcohol dehydrogenase [Planctomycetota bacterium]